ncbi:MAG: helix-turn-helix domain-containing protein [Spartobacteria bacterium]
MTDSLQVQLQEIGLLPAEAQVYLALVRNGALSGSGVAASAGVPRSSAYLTLNSLLEKGLIEGGAENGSRFSVVAPEKTLPALVTQAKEVMAQRENIALHLGRQLASLVEPGETAPDQFVQVIRSRRGVAERYERLQLEAKKSNEVFVKAPFFVAPGNPAQEQAGTRGVAVRAVYERAVLSSPAVKPYLAEWIARGEEVRIFDGKLPHKLAIFDRKRALVHLSMPGDQMRTLFIQHPELAISLGITFDSIWSRSIPYEPATPKKPQGTAPIVPKPRRPKSQKR